VAVLRPEVVAVVILPTIHQTAIQTHVLHLIHSLEEAAEVEVADHQAGHPMSHLKVLTLLNSAKTIAATSRGESKSPTKYLYQPCLTLINSGHGRCECTPT
jgi:hypothetical protein